MMRILSGIHAQNQVHQQQNGFINKHTFVEDKG